MLFLTSIGTFAIAQSTISGVITDGVTGEALIGANVIVQGTTDGTITDLDGSYTLTTSQTPPFNIEVSYTGFGTKTMEVSSNNQIMNLSLDEGVLFGEEIVVSASRRKEKVQEAPASISVLSARKLAATPNTEAARNLINVPGVQIQQQSAARINISMRGSAGLFGTAAFPIIDYRSLVGPGIGTFDVLNSPVNNIDLQRIEVVRGPGSALYGPGVTTGVVHFITKNPIDFPGTTVELIGGELSTLGASIRHAGTNAEKKFGYKINASYKKGNEFTLTNENDADQIAVINRGAANGIFQPAVTADPNGGGIVDATLPATQLLSYAELDEDGDGNPLQPDWFNTQFNGTLEFRPSDNLSITTTAGFNTASAVFYNSQGEGLSQAREYYGQVRLQAGGFFAQAFYVDNDGGSADNPTFLYQTGNRTTIARKQLEAQLQYNFDTPNLLNANWTAGVDYRASISDSGSLVYGRQEDDDDYNLYGGYLQGKFELGKKLDLVLAGRYDQFNFLDEGAFAPRAALVFKPSPKHTFRASYNRAASPNASALQNYIDFPLSTVIPGALDIWLLGNDGPQTFDNPVISWSIPGLPDSPIDTPGFPLAYAYGAVAQPTLEALYGGLLAMNPAFEALIPILNGYFTDPTNAPTGTTGQLVGLNLFNQTPLGLTPAPIKGINTQTTFEVGYKGLLGDKLGVSLDLWNRKSENFTLFTAISPAYLLAGSDISGDLGAAVAGGFQPYITGVLTPQVGVNPLLPDEAALQQAIALLTGAVQQAFTAGGAGFADNISTFLPGGAFPFIGTTPTDQLPQNGVTHIAAGYRGFDEIRYWGADFGLEYFVNNNLSLFGNYSWVEESAFMPNAVGTSESIQLPFNLNIPTNKFRLGFNYTPDLGFRANMSFQHDDEFIADLGQFSGLTNEKNLVDAGFGYKFDNGLALDLTAINLFDNEYRAFVNMPLIGRRVLGKLTYDFGAAGPSDIDGDGVADRKDACPNIMGLKEFGGCPDSDGDGIKDSDDGCPLIAGLPNLGGCPDADGDGVTDADDDCPDSAGTAKGCPDADGDGISDIEEARIAKAEAAKREREEAARLQREAQEKAAEEARIAAEEKAMAAKEKAEKEAAAKKVAARKAEIETKTRAVFSRALTGIQFNSGSKAFKNESYSIMDEVVSIMATYPELSVKIQGHTDSQGGEETNMALSSKRANAVMEYLISKGVSPTRLSASGFGESSPIADNNTAEGRRQNRRVQFIASY